MRETRPSGSEGGEAGISRPSLPLSNKCDALRHRSDPICHSDHVYFAGRVVGSASKA